MREEKITRKEHGTVMKTIKSFKHMIKTGGEYFMSSAGHRGWHPEDL